MGRCAQHSLHMVVCPWGGQDTMRSALAEGQPVSNEPSEPEEDKRPLRGRMLESRD